MSKRIYIAGPMRGKKHYNYPAFSEAERKLRDAGWFVINPHVEDSKHHPGWDAMSLPDDHDYSSLPEGWDETDVLQRCFDAIDTCQAVFMLNGWTYSTGARSEKWHALSRELQVFFEQDGIPSPDDGPEVNVYDESILAEADRITNGDRRDTYGHPTDDWGRVAGMVNSLFGDMLVEGAQFQDTHMVMFMECVKLSREYHYPQRDNRVDGAGYWNLIQMIHDRKGVER